MLREPGMLTPAPIPDFGGYPVRVTGQPAYVLHLRAWRETSVLLEALTCDFGRVGLVARSVRSARSRVARASLEPFQPLQLDWSGRGELGTLARAELQGTIPPLRGDRLLSAMYVNELLVRMTARDDPCPELFARYALLLRELPGSPSLPWSLRRFERDLLAALGYAVQTEVTADTGEPLDAATIYRYAVEQGPVADAAAGSGVPIRGSALLALACDAGVPDGDDLQDLRHLMRALIGTHLGGRGLQSWRVLADPLRSG